MTHTAARATSARREKLCSQPASCTYISATTWLTADHLRMSSLCSSASRWIFPGGIPYAQRVIAADANRFGAHFALGASLLDTGPIELAQPALREAEKCCDKDRIFNHKRVSIALLDALLKTDAISLNE